MDEHDLASQILTLAAEDFGIEVLDNNSYRNIVDTLPKLPTHSRRFAVLNEVRWAYEKINSCLIT